MANMGYCRHENTFNDLQDVYEKWDDFDEAEATDDEIRARDRLLKLIKEMATNIDVI